MAPLRSAARSVRVWRMSSSRAAACLSSSSCSWPYVAGRNPGHAPLSASVSQSAASQWMPCLAAFVRNAAGAQAARMSYRRIAAWICFPLSPPPPFFWVGPCRGQLPASQRALGRCVPRGGAQTPCPPPLRAFTRRCVALRGSARVLGRARLVPRRPPPSGSVGQGQGQGRTG